MFLNAILQRSKQGGRRARSVESLPTATDDDATTYPILPRGSHPIFSRRARAGALAWGVRIA